MPGKLRSALGLDSHTNGVRLPLDVECELDARNHASLFSVARKIDRYGSSSFIHAEKIELTQQLGVQLRDLRVLDPFLACSCPSAVLCRDKALVVNLEHINCIVTTDYVLMADDQDNTCLSFAKELQRRCAPQNRRTGCQELDDQLTGTATPFCNNPYELMVLDLVLDVVGL
jgi:magnesium transporter